MTPTQPTYASVYSELEKIAANVHTFNRLVTTNARIAQTPTARGRNRTAGGGRGGPDPVYRGGSA